MRRWRGVLMAGVLLFTAACGSDSSDEGASGTKAKQQAPLDVVLASSTKTVEAKSSKAAFTLLTQGVQGVPGGSITITGEGAFDYAGRQGVDQLGQAAGVGFNSISQASSGDSTQALQFLKGSGADMVEVGKEQVRGDPSPTTGARST